MFCTKCGNPIGENDVFCVKCGCPVERKTVPTVEATVAEEPVAESPVLADETVPEIPVVADEAVTEVPVVVPAEAPVAELPVDEVAPVSDGDVATAVTGETEIGEAPAVDVFVPAKKSKKGLVLGILAAAVVAVAAVVVFAFPYLSNFVNKTFRSPEGYFHSVESSAANKTSNSFVKYYGKFSDNYASKPISGDYELRFKIDPAFLNQLTSNAAVGDFSWVSDIYTKGRIEKADMLYRMTSEFGLGDTQIINIEEFIDLENLKVLLKLPELSDEYVGYSAVGNSSGNDYADFNKINAILKKLPDSKTVAALYKKYYMIAVNEIDNVNLSDDELSVGDFECNCTLITSKINGKTIKNIALAVLEAAENDEELEELINGLEIDEFDYDDFVDAVEDAIKDVKEEDYDDFPTTKYKTWINGKGKIVGRSLKVEGGELYYKMPTDGDDFAFEAGIVPEDEYDHELLITGSGTDNGNKLNGKFTVEYDENEIIDIEVKDFIFDVDKDICSGSISVSPTKNIQKLLKNSLGSSNQILSIIDGLKFDFNFNISNESEEISIAASNSKSELLSLSFKYTVDESTPTVTLPEAKYEYSAENPDFAENFAKTVKNVKGLEEKLSKTSIPKQYIDLLLEPLYTNEDKASLNEYAKTVIDFEYFEKVNLVDQVAPQKYWDAFCQSNNVEKSDLTSLLTTGLASTSSQIKAYYGDDVKIVTEIESLEAIDSSSYSYTRIKNSLNSMYGIIDSSIGRMYNVSLTLTVSGSVTSDTDTGDMFAVQIDGVWYILNNAYDFGI